jgi:penicillin-binding protein 1A
VWVGRDDDSSLGKISGGTVPARIWRNFMSSALAVDDKSGTDLPASYRKWARESDRPARHPSPLPEEWSEGTRPLRELARAVRELVDGG